MYSVHTSAFSTLQINKYDDGYIAEKQFQTHTNRILLVFASRDSRRIYFPPEISKSCLKTKHVADGCTVPPYWLMLRRKASPHTTRPGHLVTSSKLANPQRLGSVLLDDPDKRKRENDELRLFRPLPPRGVLFDTSFHFFAAWAEDRFPTDHLDARAQREEAQDFRIGPFWPSLHARQAHWHHETRLVPLPEPTVVPGMRDPRGPFFFLSFGDTRRAPPSLSPLGRPGAEVRESNCKKKRVPKDRESRAGSTQKTGREMDQVCLQRPRVSFCLLAESRPLMSRDCDSVFSEFRVAPPPPPSPTPASGDVPRPRMSAFWRRKEAQSRVEGGADNKQFFFFIVSPPAGLQKQFQRVSSETKYLPSPSAPAFSLQLPDGQRNATLQPLLPEAADAVTLQVAGKTVRSDA
ncbi:hypothetical protein L249_2495, partial [Ophiocordyceps polyrhachis-furcata BCC 54312]